MAFHDTKKNNGYHSVFINILTCLGGPFFSGHVVVLGLSSRDICSRSAVRASDNLNGSFAPYKFVTYLRIYFNINTRYGELAG